MLGHTALVLGIESATPVASVALADKDGLLGELMLNVGLTHSEQLLPLIDDLLRLCRRTIREVTAIGVSSGPGSFTGLRIGMATAKALAQGLSVTAIPIPTLEAMAWQTMGGQGWVSPMLFARKEQIYTALYRWRREEIVAPPDQSAGRVRGKKDRLYAGVGDGRWVLESHIQPEAADPAVWAAKVKAQMSLNAPGMDQDAAIWLLGDGAEMFRDLWIKEIGDAARVLPPFSGLCRGSHIALMAYGVLEKHLGQDGRDTESVQGFY